MIIMNSTDTESTSVDNSILLFRSLITELDLSNFTEAQLYDLSAITAESAEGLCEGLLCTSEFLKNADALSLIESPQMISYLKATAHLLPALFELCRHAEASIGLRNIAKN